MYRVRKSTNASVVGILLAVTGLAGGAVLRRSGWFGPGSIHSSAESLH